MKCFFASALLLINVLCTAAIAQPANNAAPAAPPQAQITPPAAPSQQPQGTSAGAGPTSAVKLNTWNCSLTAAEFNFWRFEVVVTMLSTYRLQNCPASSMDKITAASAAAQLRTVSSFSTIVKGGSHQQIMDINLTPVSTEYFWVSDLKFSVVG